MRGPIRRDGGICIERKGDREQSLSFRRDWLIIIGSILVGVIGLRFKHQIEGVFTKNLLHKEGIADA